MPEKQKFPSFGGSDFGIGSPSTVALEEVNSFLDDNPDELTPIGEKDKDKKDPKKKPEEQEEDKDKKPEAIVKQIAADDLFGSLKDDDEDEDNDDEADDSHEDKADKNNPLVQKKIPPKKEEEPEESTYASLTKDLLALGVFTPDEDEEGNEVQPEVKTADDFLKHFQTEVKKQTGTSIQKFLERFGPEYEEMFQAVYVNGVPPYEYISRQAKIENIENFDITSEDNQEKIVRQWYKDQGLPADRIEARITKVKNYGDLEDEAKEAQRVLVIKEQKDLQNLAVQKQQDIQRKQKIKADYTNSVLKIIQERAKAKDFDGIPVEKKFAEQTYNYLTKDAYETPDKKTLTEFDKDILDLDRPENHATKVKVAMLLQMIKTDPALSKLGKRAVSKEADKLFNEVERKFGKSKTPVKKEEESSSYSNW